MSILAAISPKAWLRWLGYICAQHLGELAADTCAAVSAAFLGVTAYVLLAFHVLNLLYLVISLAFLVLSRVVARFDRASSADEALENLRKMYRELAGPEAFAQHPEIGCGLCRTPMADVRTLATEDDPAGEGRCWGCVGLLDISHYTVFPGRER
jgi:hypothetical protein